MARQPRMTLAQARSILQPNRGKRTRRGVAWLEVLFPFFVGTAVHEASYGQNLLTKLTGDPKRAMFAAVYAWSGFNPETGQREPLWNTIQRTYIPAAISWMVIKFVQRRVLHGRPLRAFGVRLL